MSRFGRSLLLAGAYLVLLVPAQFVSARVDPAHAFDLSGAWATNQELCSHVFAKKGKQVVFAELSDLYGSGFIIDGKRISGKAAKCTITSRQDDGDDVTLSAACSTSIMKSNVQFSLTVIDDNGITRHFPDMPEMKLNYYRCPL
jgi:hypothetical protein